MRAYFTTIAGVLHQELRAIAADQQALADALAPVAAGDPALVRRLQDFDSLRQRLEMLARVAAGLEQGGGALDDAAVDALLARIEVDAVRDAFAAPLGRPVSGGAGEDVELF